MTASGEASARAHLLLAGSAAASSHLVRHPARRPAKAQMRPSQAHRASRTAFAPEPTHCSPPAATQLELCLCSAPRAAALRLATLCSRQAARPPSRTFSLAGAHLLPLRVAGSLAAPRAHRGAPQLLPSFTRPALVRPSPREPRASPASALPRRPAAEPQLRLLLVRAQHADDFLLSLLPSLLHFASSLLLPLRRAAAKLTQLTLLCEKATAHAEQRMRLPAAWISTTRRLLFFPMKNWTLCGGRRR